MTAGDRLPSSEIVLYQTEDGETRIQCRFEDGSIWLPQRLIAELFQVTVPTVNEHLSGIYADGELPREATIRNFRVVRLEGSREVARDVEHYSLPAILAVGMRVRSQRGTQFRQWALARLHEYLVKGFVMDDERLANPPGPGVPDYFDELLERIRDIRASERRMYLRVRDILALAADYAPAEPVTQAAFQAIQNKLHVVRTIESGTSVNASDEPATDGKAGVLETSCVYSGKFDPAENKTIADKEVDTASCPLKIGTHIVSRRNTPDLIGAAGLVTAASANLFLPDRLWQVSLDPRATQGELVAALAPVESRLMQRYKAAQAAQTAATHAGDARAEAAARDEISALLLFKSDLGALVRLYTFLSQVFDYGNTAVEERAIFFKRPLPLLEFGRERQGIDVSKLVLTHHNLKDQGRYATPLGSGETPKLGAQDDACSL